MRADYKRRNDVKFINPYTFIPISKGEPVRRKAEGEGSKTALHTGVLRCRLFVRTPLGIPDTERGKMDPNVEEHMIYPFFSYGKDGQKVPVIPGSSLRGVIRSVFETATDSCFSTLREDTGLSKRAEYKEAYQPGILKWEKGKWHLYQAERYLLAVDPGIFMRNGERSNYTKYEGKGLPADVYVNVIQEEEKPRVAKTRNGEEFRFGDQVEFQPYTENGARYSKNGYPIWSGVARNVSKKQGGGGNQGGRKQGLVYIGETFAMKKHGESIFVMKEEEKKLSAGQLQKAYEGLLETLKIYGDSSINRSEGHSGYMDFGHAKKETGIPIWYSVKDKKLSLASIGRTFYNTTLNQLAGESCTRRDRLCEACALFGMVGEESRGSRIRITDAKAEAGYKFETATLKILGQPRYSYLPFYARSDSGVPNSYDHSNVEIAGRKYYWHNRRAATDRSLYTAKEKKKVNSTMELVKPGAEFCFDLYYDGITQEQLQKVIWCIHFGENEKNGNLCHKIGHGKPLGLGSVKIVIEENAERIFENGCYTWKREKMPKMSMEPKFTKSEALKKVMDFREPDGTIPIKYPFICDEHGRELTESGKNEDARHVWYQKNKDVKGKDHVFPEILPDIMKKDQSLHAYQKIRGKDFKKK